MNEPLDLKYTPTHEWIRREGITVVVGITDYGVDRLSSVTNIGLPDPDDHHYEAGEEIGVIESHETVMDFHAPIAGRVVAVNTELLSSPERVNSDPYGKGWLYKMQPDSMEDFEDLMDIDDYEENLPLEDEDDQGDD